MLSVISTASSSSSTYAKEVIPLGHAERLRKRKKRRRRQNFVRESELYLHRQIAKLYEYMR